MKQTVVAILIVISVLSAAWWYFKHEVVPPQKQGLTIRALSGTAEVQPMSGHRRTLKLHDTLEQGSRLTTGKKSAMTLDVEGHEEIRLGEDTELYLATVSDESVNLELRQGKVEAKVHRFRELRLGVTGNPNQITSRDGQFSAYSAGDGTAAFAASEGTVEVVDRSGMRATLKNQQPYYMDAAGVTAVAIPSNVLLKVDWPEQTTTSSKSIVLNGTATPGSRVHIGDLSVVSKKDGTFEATVSLQEGENKITARATGLNGDRSVESPTMTVDTRPPPVNSQTDAIWK